MEKIASNRADVKELSMILYNKLKGLMLLHAATDHLKNLINPEMFTKPNHQAFFHIMHYLFYILDPVECKKRFFWPITDKKSESNFRNSTVDYLKHINEKYQLHWTNIQHYLVVMPGGKKFISFLLDFVSFIIQELIKQREKQTGINAATLKAPVSDEYMQKLSRKHFLFKEMASEYLSNIEIVKSQLVEKTQILTKQLEELAEATGYSVSQLINDKFLCDFEKHNSELYEQVFKKRRQQVEEMNKPVSDLKKAIEKFNSKDTGFKFDKHILCQQLERLKEQFPMECDNEEKSFGCKISDDAININNLIKTFNRIYETIKKEISTVNSKPCAGEFVCSKVADLKKDLEKMEKQIIDFQMMLNNTMKKQKNEDNLPHTPARPTTVDDTGLASGIDKGSLDNNFLTKYVCTPLIKLGMPEGVAPKPRLPLMDSKSSSSANETWNSFLAPRSTRQARANSVIENSYAQDPNQSLNRPTTLIDPMQLLRSLNKDTSKYKPTAATPQLNISSHGSKWKERQKIFSDNFESNSEREVAKSEASDESPELNENRSETLIKQQFTPQSFGSSTSGAVTIIHTSPFTPAKPQQLFASSRGFLDSTSSPYTAKKLGAIKKVKDASLNYANLSTSPSGRLEPLVTAIDFQLPKMKLNDFTINMDDQQHEVCDGLNNSLNTSSIHDLSFSVETAVNHQTPIKPKVGDDDDDDDNAIFNISDSVLKDTII